jgi:DNA-directed RNA polymerase specialized sigma subunit
MDDLLTKLKDRLSRRDFKILKLRFTLELTQRQIAKRVRLSQQAVSKVIANALRVAGSIAMEVTARATPTPLQGL